MSPTRADLDRALWALRGYEWPYDYGIRAAAVHRLVGALASEPCDRVKIVELAGPTTKIVPGHGTVVDKSAVAAHRDMIVALRDKVAPMVKQGMTLEQVAAAKPTAAYDAKVPGVGTTGDRFVGQLYAELKTPPGR